ncbi:MAG: right-handed parallel beta-helix repeat-containing protein [Candidatus Bathyarchaeota archaeon]|nr:right-handed parallel beta-helix repeat-containing protein [Candidatus Bathyarchaeota archaeon]MDH5746674.1 right-handed parallel beta-helix repeat-containing protein [Candidatus Bathyarchaeota archaeon]
MEKKIVLTICGLLLSTCLLNVATYNLISLSSPEATVSVSPPHTPAQICDTFEINITVTDCENLFRFEIVLYYDGELLEFLEAKSGPRACDWFTKTEVEEGGLYVNLTLIAEFEETMKESSGILAIIKFKCIKVGEGGFDFLKCELQEDFPHDDIPSGFERGTYRVTEIVNEKVLYEDYTLCTDVNFPGYHLFTINASNVELDLNSHTINNTAEKGYAVVVLEGRSNVTIKNGVITNFQYGIEIQSGCSNINIINVTVSNSSETAINIVDSHNVHVCNNIVSYNMKEGILLNKCSHSEVSRNLLSKNEAYGIYMKDSVNNNISHNTISDNYALDPDKRESGGIRIYYSGQNTIFNNNFINNTQFLTTTTPNHFEISGGVKSQNAWDWSYPYGGNYWDDYDGVDEFSGTYPQNVTGPDGIWDRPYYLNGYNQDEYPLMNRYNTTLKIFEFAWKVKYQTPNMTSEPKEICCPVAVFSDSSITDFSFNRTLRYQISSKVSNGTFCKVIVPKELLYGAFTVLIDDILTPSILDWDENQVFINVTYTEGNHNIKIKGQITIIGDLTGDGKVGIRDIAMAVKNFGVQQLQD